MNLHCIYSSLCNEANTAAASYTAFFGCDQYLTDQMKAYIIKILIISVAIVVHRSVREISRVKMCDSIHTKIRTVVLSAVVGRVSRSQYLDRLSSP